MATTPTTLQGLGTNGLVPKPIATEILAKAQENSVVQQLAQSTAMPLTGSSIAVQTGHIEAGVVGEGQAKPVSSGSYAVKTMAPVKVAAIAIVSKELRMANPAGVLDNIKGDLAGAITRAFDLAVLYGRNAITGNKIAGVESVNDTTTRIALGTNDVKAGGITADILAGYNAVTQSGSVFDDFDGIAATKAFRSDIFGAVDANGRPVFQPTIDLRSPIDSMLGIPVAYGNAVSGKIGASTDAGVRAFGGDFGSLKYGFAEQLTISMSNQATIVDGDTTYNLWQQNLEAYLVEAIFGWVIPDTKSFVAFEAPKAGAGK